MCMHASFAALENHLFVPTGVSPPSLTQPSLSQMVDGVVFH